MAMTFKESVRTCWSKYATFTGRARRSEFWWWILFTVIVSVAADLLDSIFFGSDFLQNDGFDPLTTVANFVLLLPTLAVAARRLHDIDKSGWWQLLGLIPIVGTIVLLVWTIRQGELHPNRFGANPREILPPPSPQDYVPPRR